MERRTRTASRVNAAVGLATLVLASPLPACVTCTPRDHALCERPDTSTPALTFESFRAAVRCDDPIAAYRCLSEEMKSREGIQLTEVLVWWDGTFKRNPFARLAGNAEIVSMDFPDDRHRRILVGAYGQQRIVELVRQQFFDVRLRDRTAPIDDYVGELGELIRIDGDAATVRLRDARLAGIDRNDIVSLTLGTEWKILRFIEPPSTTTP